MMKTVPKRKREGITDYRKRYRLVKSDSTRLVVRYSGKGVAAQLVQFNELGDRVLFTFTDRSLKKRGIELEGNNTTVCYLVGYAIGKKAKELGIEYSILDTGRRAVTWGGRIASVLKGYADSGVEIPHSEDILPDKGRIEGKHLKNKPGAKFKEYVKKLEGT